MKVRARVMGVVVSSLLMVSALAIAQDGPPSGKVWLESTSVALGIGVSWGDGKLTVQGKEHVFKVEGLSVVDLGVSKITATGEVFNLKKVADFSGNYVAGTGRRDRRWRRRRRHHEEPERRRDEAHQHEPRRPADARRLRRRHQAEELTAGAEKGPSASLAPAATRSTYRQYA